MSYHTLKIRWPDLLCHYNYWCWCFHPLAGYYLDIWLLLRGRVNPAKVSAEVQALWQQSPAIQYRPPEYWQTRPFVDLTETLKQFAKRLNRTDKNNPDQQPDVSPSFPAKFCSLEQGFAVLQKFYQGRLFQPALPEHEGKALPALGKSQLPKHIKKRKVPEQQRYSQGLYRLLAQLPSQHFVPIKHSRRKSSKDKSVPK